MSLLNGPVSNYKKATVHEFARLINKTYHYRNYITRRNHTQSVLEENKRHHTQLTTISLESSVYGDDRDQMQNKHNKSL